MCRDGSATYAEAIRRALPDAVQVSDRWHLWRNLCDKVQLEVRAHTGCWATINPPRPGGVREQTTRERWNKIHDLLGQGIGLLDRRRLGLTPSNATPACPNPRPCASPPPTGPPSSTPTATICAPAARPIRQLLASTELLEIRELGYTGSANLLVRHLNQGRAEGDRPVTTPRHASRLLLTNPEHLRPKEATLLEKIANACPEMTALADLVGGFATLLKPAEGNDVKLTEWITAARAVDLPHLRSLTNGLEIDRPAVNAGLTLPYHNGRTEGVNTRTKRIMRQMHGRAGFDLLRHCIPPPRTPSVTTDYGPYRRSRHSPVRVDADEAVCRPRYSYAERALAGSSVSASEAGGRPRGGCRRGRGRPSSPPRGSTGAAAAPVQPVSSQDDRVPRCSRLPRRGAIAVPGGGCRTWTDRPSRVSFQPND